MHDETRRLIESEWADRLGVSRIELRGTGVQVVHADVGSNAAMSFLFGSKCIIAVPLEAFGLATNAIAGVEDGDAFTSEFLRTLVGGDVVAEGPSWHGYVDDDSFKGSSDRSVDRIELTDTAFVDFLMGCDPEDVGESGFRLNSGAGDAGDNTRYWALRERGAILASGLMSEWRGHDADVGVLTHPNHRGRGLARRVVATMTAAALPSARVVRYRALTTNLPSLAVARSLGFEEFGQNYRARRP